MARAYLHVDWLEQSSIGLSGGLLEIPFIIEIDTAGDDPYTPLLAACPYGSELRSVSGVPVSIARRFVGMVTVEYGFPRLLNEKTYKAIVTYGPLSNRTIGQWRRSVRFASETRQLIWSLPERNAQGGFTSGGRPKRVGTYEFAHAAEGETSDLVLENGQKVKKTGNFNDVNWPVNDGITSIIYDILTPQLTAKQVRELASLKWHTNQNAFLGYENWSLIFANWESHDEVMVIPGSRPIAAWYSNLSLEILFKAKDKDLNPYGWRAFVLNDVMKYDNGATRPVFNSSGGQLDPSANTFVQYPQVDFNGLFSIINAGVPVN